jgi:5,10-methylenetetrahydromethanopterin reductase
VARSKPLEYGVLLSGDLTTHQVIELAERVEAMGFTDLFHADERFSRDVYALLSPVALATSRLRLGPLTADPFSRHPAVQAMAIGTLAELSGGRAVLGFGAGSSGFATIGVDRSQVLGRIREAIELIRLLLTATENVSFEGRFFRFVNDRLLFGPIPHVPVVIGTRAPKTLALAGEVADGVNVGGYTSPPTIQWALDHVDDGLRRAGRRPDDLRVIVHVYACVHDDRSTALDAARWGTLVALWSSLNILDELPLGAPVPEQLLRYMQTTQKSFHPETMQPGMKMIPDELMDALSLAGTPDDCAEKVSALAAMAGGRIDELVLLPCPAPGQTKQEVVYRFAEEVFPQVVA